MRKFVGNDTHKDFAKFSDQVIGFTCVSEPKAYCLISASLDLSFYNHFVEVPKREIEFKEDETQTVPEPSPPPRANQFAQKLNIINMAYTAPKKPIEKEIKEGTN